MSTPPPSLDELRARALAAAAPPPARADLAINCERLVRIFTADGVEGGGRRGGGAAPGRGGGGGPPGAAPP
ncbi:hypothetical protein ACFV6F_14750, partial [Kitasatospora phosalacinea]